MRITLGADKVTLFELTRASLRLLFVITEFYPCLDIFGNLLLVCLTIIFHHNKDVIKNLNLITHTQDTIIPLIKV